MRKNFLWERGRLFRTQSKNSLLCAVGVLRTPKKTVLRGQVPDPKSRFSGVQEGLQTPGNSCSGVRGGWCRIPKQTCFWGICMECHRIPRRYCFLGQRVANSFLVAHGGGPGPCKLSFLEARGWSWNIPTFFCGPGAGDGGFRT